MGAPIELPESEEGCALHRSVIKIPSITRYTTQNRQAVVQVGASNELPESEELDALYDRFLVRREVRQVSAANLNALLRTTDTAIAARASGDPASPASASETLVNHEDFTSVRCAAAATFPVCWSKTT